MKVRAIVNIKYVEQKRQVDKNSEWDFVECNITNHSEYVTLKQDKINEKMSTISVPLNVYSMFFEEVK